MGVTESMATFPRANLSYQDYLDWKKSNKVFTSLEAYTRTGYMLAAGTGTELVAGARVSDGFFRTLGVTPVLGRDFYAGEDLPSAPQAVMLSYATWQKRYGGRKDVIGQTVTLSGMPSTIVGVLPRGFQFAPRNTAEFWSALHANSSCELRRSCHNMYGIARLKDGVSVQAALAEMTGIAQQLERQYPDSNRGQGASVVPFAEIVVGDVRPILLTLLGGAGLLLLIACVNVASLLLVRSESRSREIAVRGALGASRARLTRQFITEGLLLASIGGAIGVAAAAGAMQLLMHLLSKDMLANMPYLDGLGMNVRIFAFAGGVALLAAVVFSLTPVLRLSGSDIREGLAEGSRGSAGVLWRRLGSNLVVVELAIAMVLLVGAGLLGKSFYRLLHVELGFQPDHLATVQVAVPPLTYPKDEQGIALARKIVAGTAALPGVKSVAVTSMLPVSGNGNTDWIRFVGRPYDGKHNEVNSRDVSADYFTTLQAKLVRGRYFSDDEDESKPRVALINQALARKYYPGEDPIGKTFGDTSLTPKSIRQIVGIVEDIKEASLDNETWPTEYLPINQGPDGFYNLVARTSQAEQTVLPAMDAVIHQIDSGIGTQGEITMVTRINDSPTAALHRSSAWLVGGFAALALVLGVVGLYGVIAYSVSQRTREIGVRMALGAQRGTVYGLILKEAGWLTGWGIVAGVVCSIGGATLMRGLLFGTAAWDVPTLLGVALVLAVSAMMASFIPARRAASVNPVDALRAE
jgi:predicted permease